MCSLLVEPRRPADPSIITTTSSSSVSGGDGTKSTIPILQLWGLSTLSRKEGALIAASKVGAAVAS